MLDSHEQYGDMQLLKVAVAAAKKLPQQSRLYQRLSDSLPRVCAFPLRHGHHYPIATHRAPPLPDVLHLLQPFSMFLRPPCILLTPMSCPLICWESDIFAALSRTLDPKDVHHPFTIVFP